MVVKKRNETCLAKKHFLCLPLFLRKTNEIVYFVITFFFRHKEDFCWVGTTHTRFASMTFANFAKTLKITCMTISNVQCIVCVIFMYIKHVNISNFVQIVVVLNGFRNLLHVILVWFNYVERMDNGKNCWSDL